MSKPADTGHRVGIFPGTFDPVTRGHLDIIERSRRIFDEMVVALLRNPGKEPLFDAEVYAASLSNRGARFFSAAISSAVAGLRGRRSAL